VKGGDLKTQDLPMETINGDTSKLADRGDARMQEQAAILTTNTGQTGKIGERNPLIDVLKVDLKLAREGLFGLGSGGFA
jgi:hypothetical protein